MKRDKFQDSFKAACLGWKNISVLGSETFICVLPVPSVNAHPPEPLKDTKLTLDSITVILCFTYKRTSVDTLPYICNCRIAGDESQAIYKVPDSGCEAKCWDLLVAFPSPQRSADQVYVPLE